MADPKSAAAERFLSAPWLEGADPSAHAAIMDALVESRLPSGTVLIEENQPNDRLVFLIGGSAAIERGQPGHPERIEVLATVNAPSILGTTTFFTPNAPNFRAKAAGEVWLLTLDHPSHDRLRREHPAAAEALAVASARVLSERFDYLDRMFTGYMALHPYDQKKVTEWAGFRARLFDERSD